MNMSVTNTFTAETKANIIWFRHGLRLHDNPALLEAIADKVKGVALIPLFIFDGETAGIKNVGYNRMSFLLDSLHDIDEQLREVSSDKGCLHMFQGKPSDIFRSIHQYVRIEKICFEQDCEPIWKERDDSVRKLCLELGIKVVEKVSHTLWDPRQVISTNGGIPPLTYQMFLHTVQVMGFPERPVQNADWNEVSFFKFTAEQLLEFSSFPQLPIPEDLNIYRDDMINMARFKWRGGERQALLHLNERLKVEDKSFKQGLYLPNQANPNILETSKSMSAHLRFGCLSVRRFYWDIHDLFRNVQQQAAACGFELPGGAHITGQLIWREYFYTMSVNNPNYDRMEGNEICLNIPWAPKSDDQLQRWQRGQTGFPIIDAAMRQLLAEGWLHHTLRNTVAMFLTRGGLWQNWEYGLQHFLKYLLDADWSVCAGNWMWVSSSAFEGLLDSTMLSCPVMLSKRLDPQGEYIKHYVYELKHLPKEYVHNPWLMSSAMQNQYNCIVGVNYPERMIDLTVALQRNSAIMKALRKELIENSESNECPPHCRPSREQEIRQLFWLYN